MSTKTHTSPKKGANILSRVRNISPENVMDYVNNVLPKHKTSLELFKKSCPKWSNNIHQAPEQFGLCYCDNGYIYPRFNRNITLEEATNYVFGWMKVFPVINPMSKLSSTNDASLVKSIALYMEKNHTEHNLKDIIQALVGDEPIIVNDILANTLNNYSEMFVVKEDKKKDIFEIYLRKNYKHTLIKNYMDKKEFFHLFDNLVNTSDSEHGYSHQVIYYGAPGTGKSFQVKELTRGESFFRTTFHPDSDYSTFVGCYKPTMKGEERILSKEELKVVLPKNGKETYACQKFATRYWRSLNQLTTKEIEEILVSHGYTTTMCLEIKKGIAVGEEIERQHKDTIVYKFIPQAFLQAYVQAWNYYAKATNEEEKIKKQFLVIEEINRGNCAQIFGDLFQLLDRNEAGFSDYYINADNDIKAYLKEAFKEINEDAFLHKDKINAIYNKGVSSQNEVDVVNEVLSGEILLLPNNFFIWATMNTSDQSLFPIDSAFKRRWDWIYVPIADVQEKNWKIVITDRTYDWWNFLEKINEYIGSITNSEDKKLGFFFCQAKNDEIIDADMFVSKVLFYLWNDVFKDYGFESDLFKIEDNQLLTFDKFYKPINGKTEVNLDNVKKFLENLKVETKEQVASETPKEQSIENEITPNE